MYKKPLLTLFLSLLAVLFLFPQTTARADGIIVPEPPIDGPIPLSGALDIVYHHVDVTIEDQVAVTHVDQVFRNPNDFTVEGSYIFPLPPGAVVTDFVLWIDGEAVHGEVLSAEEARAKYEEIVRQMIDPAILEYVGQGAVQASIFPILPGEERRIELEYAQTLTNENGLVGYQYPLNTEKFSRIPLEEVTISVQLNTNSPLRAVYSPSHDVGISRDSDTSARIGYEAYDVKPDTDFLLYYSVGETEAFHLLSYLDPNDPADPDGFFLLMLAPRPDAGGDPVPKDVLIVLDKSGSMDGEKYVQAQAATRFILENLNEDDGFNVITFSTGVDTFSDELLPASQAGEAIEWIESDRPLGSTDINLALLTAASMVQSSRPTYVIFLTDGLPTEGETDADRILSNFADDAPDNVRLFAFGVGYDVDTFLLDLLAGNHHGASSYVVPGERIDEKVSAFYQKIQTPVMTDLELEVDGVTLFDGYPTPLPDLFVGSQIILVGRYRDGGGADVTLRGVIDGETHSFSFPDQHFATGFERGPETQSLQAVPRLWATRKIGFLLNEIRLHGPNEETIDQIVRLSIRFGIVTPYTSYLVTEDMALGEEAIESMSADEFEQQAAAPEEPTSGESAVERSSDQAAMEGADSVSGPPASAAEQVRVLGSRTYINLDGVWTDTAYDPGTMETLKVPFLSDDYFDLAAARPELAAAFSLGTRVIAFSGGEVFEVVAEDQPGDPVDVEPPQLDPDDPLDPSDPVDPADPAAPETGFSIPCLGGLLPLVVLAPLGYLARKRKSMRSG